ncbi:exodeoxyribonuclease V subunit beta [Candidatus Methylocalor cossyra]|uniref:RecBCD enzyme subunit RecB n=1 Tax=Candidatus Methylocalor cossyra TaxID=3108543 RepID=A0ABM9NI02_9GAMM
MSREPIPEFDLYRTELAGLHLVEASAGTGKTWTISGLYARLILEQGLGVEQILVVTYTKAATAELRDRIRRRLRDLVLAFEQGAAGQDEFCRAMLERHCGERRAVAIARLTRAIGGFDQAAVFTIHGFCQRLLSDSAFEAGSDFECEVLPDQTDLLREIVEDFWRREVYHASPLWAAYLARHRQAPPLWLREIENQVGKPFLTVLGAEEPSELPELEARWWREVDRAAQFWHRHKDAIDALLRDFRGFKANRIQPGTLRDWLAEVDRFFACWPFAPTEVYELPECLSRLGSAALAAAVKKDFDPPRHAFFDHCQELATLAAALDAAYAARLRALKPRLLRFCNEELARRKAQSGQFSYDDLLNHLAAALEGDQGEALAETIRRRYRAALIDEFQDTDPVQYRIFRTVYGDGRLPVFWVGDPKQAIYGFRGADLFSYLEARDTPGIRRGTLLRNQRSEPTLIAAVNALFRHRPRPFLLDAISFPEALPAARERPVLQVAGDGAEPLRFLLLPPGPEGGAWGKAQASALAAAGCASAIAGLLRAAAEGSARLGERSLNGGDIAVLVATHRQARQIQEQLHRLGIPSVRQGQDNVFESPEAAELERVLRAVAEPGGESRLTAALATELMGYTANAIHALQQTDQAGWERLFERFQGYRWLWLREGFMPMFRRWFAEANVAERLAEFHDGERRLTNLLHLAELLQAESRRKPGLDALLAWFGQAIRQPPKADEAAQLRLESDAKRVKIVTIHASKGLEYPIVFCPFLWDGRLALRKSASLSFHLGWQSVLDLGSPALETHRPQAVREELSEKLRLLYVALTRAVYRCYLVWGLVRNGQDRGDGLHSTALGWLLHGDAESDAAEDPLAALQARLEAADHAALLNDLQTFAARVPSAVRLQPMDGEPLRYRAPAEEPRAELALSPYRRPGLYPAWRMSSFTALVTGRHSEDPDYDLASEPEAELPAPGDSLFAFPRGVEAGACLHAILEDWDFTCRDGDRLGEWVRRKLKAHGLDQTWTDAVRRGIEDLLAAPLDKGGLKLGDIPPHRRLVEMEFTYPLRSGTARQLQRLLQDPAHGCDPRFAEAAECLDFKTVAGYMKGFIDLVFEAGGRYYLVDYKSHWLGNAYRHYAPARLTAVIAREHYYLQYLIYTVALHRYLKLRVADYRYETHFGGVYYLFLRGIKPGQRTGIYWDRPGPALIEGVEKILG